MNERPYMPAKKRNSEQEIWSWYENLQTEISQCDLSEDEMNYFLEYYNEAGLLRPYRRSFFRWHFSRSFAQAADFLLEDRSSPHILDLGCGTGTQSLYLALQGARITALDLDEVALSVFRKRIKRFEAALNRKLDIEIVAENVFDFDFKSAKFDGVYSMFAFNMMQPSRELLAQLLPSLQSKGRVVITDGNNTSWLAKYVPSRRRDVLSPQELARIISDAGFRLKYHSGAFSVPPPFWIVGTWVVGPVDTLLSRNWFWAISQQLLVERVS